MDLKIGLNKINERLEKLDIKISEELENLDIKIDILIDEIKFDGYKGCDSCKRGFLHFNEFVYQNNKIIATHYVCDSCNSVTKYSTIH